MPKSRTTKISKDTVQINHRLGFIIIKPSESFDIVPIFCNVCEIRMDGELDRQYYEKYSCCFSCGVKWADGNQSEWHTGWRPKADEIKEEKNRRMSDSL